LVSKRNEKKREKRDGDIHGSPCGPGSSAVPDSIGPISAQGFTIEKDLVFDILSTANLESYAFIVRH
jgi:hypothetical protein